MTSEQVKALKVGDRVWEHEAEGKVGERPDPDCTPIVWYNGVVDYVYHDEDRKFCGLEPDALGKRPGKKGLFACVPNPGAPYLPPM